MVDVNGLALHVVEAGPVDGRPVMMLHGFPEFWWAWRKQIDALAEAGFRVIAPDMRGYNLSDAPQQIEDYALDTLAADVAGVATALGHDRFDLVAHDWGAVVAWWTAVKYPGRVSRMVVMDGPHPDVWDEARRHLTQALRSTYAMFFQLPWLPEATLSAFDFAGLRKMMSGTAAEGTFSDEDLDRYVEAWDRPDRLTAMLNYYRAFRQRESGKGNRVTVPTLILWGSEDSAVEERVARASLEQCDDCRLEVLEGASHWLHLEQPVRVNQLILSHLG